MTRRTDDSPPNNTRANQPVATKPIPRMTRRSSLRLLGGALATTPLASAFGCGGSMDATEASADGATSPDAAGTNAPTAGGAMSPTTATAGSTDAQSGPMSSTNANVAGGSGSAGSGTPAGSSAPATTSAAGASGTDASPAAGGAAGTNAQMANAGTGAAGSGPAGAVATGPVIDGWAMGGTAAMADPAAYSNPFGPDPETSCMRTQSMTLGPCHDDLAPEREDVSEDKPGLPMRFGLRILNERCEPITDANVDMWQCDADGIYSSETSDVAAFCTGNVPEAQPARWFRGHRQVDETGVVWFNSCFPGWYQGRAIHVHVTVRRNSRQGTEALTTQLGFDPALIEEICSTHPDYMPRGQPDTPNSTDMFFQGTGYLMETERMRDGVMLAWKTLIIPS